MADMVCLTSVYGSFRAHVLAARLASEGLDVELRGALGGPYAVTVGELARVDVYVPADQAEDASYVLRCDEIDEADEILDLDRPPVTRPVRRWVVVTALVGAVTLLVVDVLGR